MKATNTPDQENKLTRTGVIILTQPPNNKTTPTTMIHPDTQQSKSITIDNKAAHDNQYLKNS